jgi:hypothetical protein
MECLNSQTLLTVYLICFQAQDAFFKCVEADARHTTRMEVTAVGRLYPSHCKAVQENYEHLCWSSICYPVVSCICMHLRFSYVMLLSHAIVIRLHLSLPHCQCMNFSTCTSPALEENVHSTQSIELGSQISLC